MEPEETLERLVPDQVHVGDEAGTQSLELHLERYEFASQHARPGRLLDLACGVGYGTRLLADRREDLHQLTGVDVSTVATDYALRHYACERVGYLLGDAMTFGGEGESFDTIVSLETIEHLPEPHLFFARLCGMLAPEGVLIASVPTTPSVDLNPHHLHDFTEQGFRALGSKHGLVEVACHSQIQRVAVAELFSGDSRFRRDNLRPNLAGYYLSHPGALVGRIVTTLRHGLANHYLTIVWKRDG